MFIVFNKPMSFPSTVIDIGAMYYGWNAADIAADIAAVYVMMQDSES